MKWGREYMSSKWKRVVVIFVIVCILWDYTEFCEQSCILKGEKEKQKNRIRPTNIGKIKLWGTHQTWSGLDFEAVEEHIWASYLNSCLHYYFIANSST